MVSSTEEEIEPATREAVVLLVRRVVERDSVAKSATVRVNSTLPLCRRVPVWDGVLVLVFTSECDQDALLAASDAEWDAE